MNKAELGKYGNIAGRFLAAAGLVVSACKPWEEIHVGQTPPSQSQTESCLKTDIGEDEIFPCGQELSRFLVDRGIPNGGNISKIIEAAENLPALTVEIPPSGENRLNLPVENNWGLGIQAITFSRFNDPKRPEAKGELNVALEFGDNVFLGNDFQQPSTPIPAAIVTYFHPYTEDDDYWEVGVSGTHIYKIEHDNQDVQDRLQAPLKRFSASFYGRDIDLKVPVKYLVILINMGFFEDQNDRPHFVPYRFRIVNPSGWATPLAALPFSSSG